MLPTRDELIDELVRLRDEGERRPDEASRSVAGECRIALYALMQAHNAVARNEPLGGLQYLRLLAEAAIRVRWMAGDNDVADGQGRPSADGETVVARARSMRKRDLKQLAAAYRAIVKSDPACDADLAPQVEALAAAIPEPAAPWDLRGMATSHTGRRLYAGHRLCSSMIHPGTSLKRGQLLPPARINEMLDDAAYLCAAWADASLRALGNS